MLREGLGAELPEVARALRAIRRPVVAREEWPWAALSGLGAAFVLSAVLGLPVAGLRLLGARDPASYAASVVAIVAAAVGAAVAWRACGPRAAALYVGVHAIAALAFAPGALMFCERSSEGGCLLRIAASQWRFAAGLAIAPAALRLFRTGETGRNGLLAGAGALVTAQALFGPLVALLVFAPTQDVVVGTAVSLATLAGAGLVAGVALRSRAGRWRAPLLLAALVLLPWTLLELPFVIGSITFSGQPQLPTLLGGPAQALAVVAGFAVRR